ncbi:MAG TPA: patatin-like phospholipase family protein [Alphaproteobacteria bacterium]|nr:patatin-like phospholipase family protein [Alphaproteobacteria bacterium]
MAKSHQKTRIVLFVYGGGMRGMVAGHILARIEEATGLAMADMVDIFTGPSTGSIITAALTTPATDYPVWHPSARPRFKAKHMVKFYEREGAKIFPPDRFRAFRGFIHDFNNRTVKISQLNNIFKHGHYNPAHLTQALKKLYGETNLNQTLRSLVIPVYNIDKAGRQQMRRKDVDFTDFMSESGQALWLKHMAGSTDPRANVDVKLYDAVLGSAAAPTFFPCHHFKLRMPGMSEPMECSGVDGSVFDSPSITWHGAVRQHIQPDEKVIMILIGTGYTGRSYKRDEWNRFGGLGVVDPRNDLPLINILFQAPESALMDGFAQDMGDNLFVFNKSLRVGGKDGVPAPAVQIDDASPENLAYMEGFANSIIEDNQARFDALCHILTQNRDQHVAHKISLWKSLRKKVFYPRSSHLQ